MQITRFRVIRKENHLPPLTPLIDISDFGDGFKGA